jgi:transposase
MLFVGDDWAEDHHDVEVQDATGKRLRRARLPEGVVGIGKLHALIGEFQEDDSPASSVTIGIETDRGPWVQALVAAGYRVIAINPRQVARYRDRYSTSGAKSDAGDARVLADIVRLEADRHRVIAGDSDLAEAIKLVARAHQGMIWARQRHVLQLRAALRESFPAGLVAFGEDLDHRDALAVLAKAPTATQAAALRVSQVEAALRRAGRQVNVRARAERICADLRTPQLRQSEIIAYAHGDVIRAQVAVIAAFTAQITELEDRLTDHFGQHPDAKILLSQPGLGVVLAARILGEFGDDKARYDDVRGRRNYAGTSPITRASGTRSVVLARFARNRRLGDALHQQAFCALLASPGVRVYYDQLRARGAGHHAALRQVSNRLVGILHGCLAHQTPYDEAKAWAHRIPAAA